jgi:hypothetical protein
MRSSYWQTRKDHILFKDFCKWAHDQAIFRVFLQKEAVGKNSNAIPKNQNDLKLSFWEGKEGEEEVRAFLTQEEAG